jgi:SPP1 family predicted phage head-tail adaptor
MRAGALRHRIGCWEPVVTQNETGEEVVTYPTSFEVWGLIEPLHGRETLQASQVNAEFDTRIGIRWSPDTDRMNAKWRLTHLAVIYNIVSIAHVMMGRRELEIMATSGLNEG